MQRRVYLENASKNPLSRSKWIIAKQDLCPLVAVANKINRGDTGLEGEALQRQVRFRAATEGCWHKSTTRQGKILEPRAVLQHTLTPDFFFFFLKTEIVGWDICSILYWCPYLSSKSCDSGKPFRLPPHSISCSHPGTFCSHLYPKKKKDKK